MKLKELLAGLDILSSSAAIMVVSWPGWRKCPLSSGK